MRHCPWQLVVRHPERFLLPLLRSPPHRHARSVRTMAVNRSTFIANANPDFHHGLLGQYSAKLLSDARAAPPSISGVIVISRTVTSESSTRYSSTSFVVCG